MTDASFLDRALCYRALQTRDARFDGRFYTCVISTGIYCRPICPARTPKQDNCIFVPTAAAAHQLGFRSCLRCRPEIAPGLPAARGSLNTVSRALALIAEGAFDAGGVEPLAERLGVGARHLRRLFDEHVGASPVEVAQSQRVLFAKRLLSDTSLPMTEVALASGFGSVRRFNDVFRALYGRAPSAVRRSSASERARGLTLKLSYRPPFAWPTMLSFLAERCVDGVERVEGDVYSRTFALGEAEGRVHVRKRDGEHALSATIDTSDVRVLGQLVMRLRRLFDLDADAASIDAHLSRDPKLKRRVRALPGVRVPGAWDPFELAVRAVLGQQVSVKAARTMANRVVAQWGSSLSRVAPDASLDRTFPSAIALCGVDFTRIGLTRARAHSLQQLALACCGDPRMLDTAGTLDATLDKWTALPGIGTWTANYIAMRALREPDAFMPSDLGLLRAFETERRRPKPTDLARLAEPWRPWRAYAALRLWLQ